jgi:hypothetical protein
MANLNEPHGENTRPSPWPSRTVKIYMTFLVQTTWAVPSISTWPVPWPIYPGRTVKIYMTRSVSNLPGPYCENLRCPFRVQSTWAVPWKSTRPIPCSVDRSRIVKICMSLAINNLDDTYVHQYIFDAFTLGYKKCTQQLRQICLTDILKMWYWAVNIYRAHSNSSSDKTVITAVFEVVRLKQRDSERESTVILQDVASYSPISKAIYPRRLEPVTITSSLHEDLYYSLGAYRV